MALILIAPSIDRSQTPAPDRSSDRMRDRIRTFLKAVIEFNNGATKIDCTIKNMSPTGARVNVTSAVSLPKEFDLHIPHRGEIMRAQLIWREKDAIGVHFSGPAQEPAPPPLPVAERSLETIEAENIRLRRRVKELSRRLENLGQDPNVDEMP